MKLTGYIVLTATGIIFALLSCVYLNLYEVKKYNLAEKITAKNIFIPVSTKRIIYEIAGIAAIAAVGIEMRYFYPNDTYVHQIKLQFLISVIFALAFIDYRYKIVPNKVILFCFLARIPFLIFEFIYEQNMFFDTLKDIGLGVLILGIFMIVFYFITKGGIGMGDVKLFIVIALFQGLTNALASIFVSMIVCFVISIVLIALRKKKAKDTLPLVPSILIGMYISFCITGM